MSIDSTPFTLVAQPGTDIWRKPPATDIFNAPISRTSTGSLAKFRSARVTFWADWHERYDQGGMLLVLRRRSSAPPSAAAPPARWIKTGVELYRGAPRLSTVATDRFADWSVAPLDDPATVPGAAAATGVTVEVAREGDEHGKSAWVYQVVPGGGGDGGAAAERVPLREICWIFADEHDGGGDGDDEWVLDVSPLVARPEKDAAAPLEVRFSEFKVEWAS